MAYDLDAGAPEWVLHVCVFQSASVLRSTASAANAGDAATSTTSPAPAHGPVVASDIRVLTQVRAPARVMGAWSASSRAELMPQGIRFYTPELHASEVLRYAVAVEADGDPIQFTQMHVSDARGPAANLSGDPNLHCDSGGLSVLRPSTPVVSESLADAPAQVKATPPPPALSETISQVVALALIEQAEAVRSGIAPRGPSFTTDYSQLMLLLAAGVLSLASLVTAVVLFRRQRHLR